MARPSPLPLSLLLIFHSSLILHPFSPKSISKSLISLFSTNRVSSHPSLNSQIALSLSLIFPVSTAAAEALAVAYADAAVCSPPRWRLWRQQQQRTVAAAGHRCFTSTPPFSSLHSVAERRLLTANSFDGQQLPHCRPSVPPATAAAAAPSTLLQLADSQRPRNCRRRRSPPFILDAATYPLLSLSRPNDRQFEATAVAVSPSLVSLTRFLGS